MREMVEIYKGASGFGLKSEGRLISGGANVEQTALIKTEDV